MKTCLIVSGGVYSALPADFKYDYCIVCDAGIRHADRMHLRPDVILGDFDSYSDAIPEKYRDIPVQTFPVEKDDTDTMLAIKLAFEKGYKHMVIACALGNRMDHTMANIQSLAYIAANGGTGEIISEDEHLMTFTGGTLELPKKERTALSLFALSDECTGLSISGTKYEVTDAVLQNTFPLGVSNKWEEDKVKIKLESGILLIIQSSMRHENEG